MIPFFIVNTEWEVFFGSSERLFLLSTLLRHKRSVGTFETQSRVLLRASIEADNTGCFLLLRVDVDAVSLEAAA